MNEQEFAMQLALLAEAFGEQKLTPVRIEAYHRNLQDLTLPIMALVVDRLIQTVGSGSFRWTALPPVADIRLAAEQIRREELGKHAMPACIVCDSTRWRPVTVMGVVRVQRCPCVALHAAAMEQLGLTTRPFCALPVGELEPEEPETLTTKQLPEGIGDRLATAMREKVIR